MRTEEITADPDPALPPGKTYVLVHGGWCWKNVTNRLRAAGHTDHCPTLTGLGERSHLIQFDPSLETFIDDIIDLIRYEDISGLILVGHSFAGAIISAVADRIPERLRHLVYLDAAVLQSGQRPWLPPRSIRPTL